MTAMQFVLWSAIMGAGATALLDLWALALNRLFGFALPNWAMVGRWLAHIPRGHLIHDDIGKAAPMAGELRLGWVFHYAVGITFAAATVLLGGKDWMAAPALALPLAVGLVTVGCGWFILQPALGAGIAAARKPDANRIRFLNIAGHIVFGLGLWLVALVLTGRL